MTCIVLLDLDHKVHDVGHKVHKGFGVAAKLGTIGSLVGPLPRGCLIGTPGGDGSVDG